MTKKIDLAGKEYIIVSIDDNCIQIREKRDRDVISVWRTNPLFSVLRAICEKARSK